MEDGWSYPMKRAALALAETRHDRAFETIVKGMDRPSHAEIVARGACTALANLRDEKGLEVLRDRTTYGHPELLRYGAAAALGKLASFHEKRRGGGLQDLVCLLPGAHHRGGP